MESELVVKILEDNITLIDTFLKNLEIFNKKDNDCSIVVDAMEYSLFTRCKRVRPVLAIELCKACGGNAKDAVPLAASVELVHTYSLMQDDMPCMDDDDLRRGQPACHKKYGEAIAMLASDALLTLAFQTISETNLSDNQKVRAIEVLSKRSGVNGMIGGQVIDLLTEGKSIDKNLLLKMYKMKTGCLISAACEMGCIAANASEIQIAAAKSYAHKIGRAFQITDDILDVTGDEKLLGKTTSDEKNKKATFVSIFGLGKAHREVEKLTKEAVEELEAFGKEGEFLKEFAIFISERRY